ncbi:TPA: hypothetical protein DIC20_04385 [Candidatus Dependentiae bacterium]|nr:MAG: hypothetical protein US03_C0004G0024 [candidate division TM6 bacterium GW2011_GWF2_36_131]KKQ03202.1 MAG: hypothetical protein US13_C0004G0024 [candidate division TM6 bacterium GW2011_GWE2_36_25]KKQ18561.1 MAG: hypothetical protein US32_C0025G0025 [candidate division TM6 bacterium GW2011_GWA2_36_9]HBR70368.1 hypothetical protein [Candidatus Dependentiae bacterium]HCU00913.1 hypothetical protein [Candidatus Dependentiae bacterium]
MKQSFVDIMKTFFNSFLILLAIAAVVLVIFIFVTPYDRGMGNFGIIVVPFLAFFSYLVFRFFGTALCLYYLNDRRGARLFFNSLFIISLLVTLFLIITVITGYKDLFFRMNILDLLDPVLLIMNILKEPVLLIGGFLGFGYIAGFGLGFYASCIFWILEIGMLIASYRLYRLGKKRWALAIWSLPLIVDLGIIVAISSRSLLLLYYLTL